MQTASSDTYRLGTSTAAMKPLKHPRVWLHAAGMALSQMALSQAAHGRGGENGALTQRRRFGFSGGLRPAPVAGHGRF